MTTERIRYRVEPGHEEAFIHAYHEAGAILERSPECLSYDILHGEQELQWFVIVIRWASIECHLQGLRKSADFAPFFAAAKPFLAAIEEMKHYKSEGEWHREGA